MAIRKGSLERARVFWPGQARSGPESEEGEEGQNGIRPRTFPPGMLCMFHVKQFQGRCLRKDPNPPKKRTPAVERRGRGEANQPAETGIPFAKGSCRGMGSEGNGTLSRGIPAPVRVAVQVHLQNKCFT